MSSQVKGVLCGQLSKWASSWILQVQEPECAWGAPTGKERSGVLKAPFSHLSYLAFFFVSMGFPNSDKEFACLCRRQGFDPWIRKIPGEGNSNPLQYSCLGNPMDRGAWRATVHEVTKSWTWLSNWARILSFYAISIEERIFFSTQHVGS